jgi:hypothetical protein
MRDSFSIQLSSRLMADGTFSKRMNLSEKDS